MSVLTTAELERTLDWFQREFPELPQLYIGRLTPRCRQLLIDAGIEPNQLGFAKHCAFMPDDMAVLTDGGAVRIIDLRHKIVKRKKAGVDNG